MKKYLKILGIILGVLILIAGIIAIYFNVKGVPYYENEARAINVQVDSLSVVRGGKMVTMFCGQCHSSTTSPVLEGRLMEEGGDFGTIYAPNITQHKKFGIGNYTDGELVYLLRTGIKKNGQFSPPWMPKFPTMADEDIFDIIAYLRSDKINVKPSDKYQPPSQPSFLVKVLTNTVLKPYPYPESEIKKPSKTNKLIFGEYLANSVYKCFSCHSKNFQSNDEFNPEKSEGFYGGGNPLGGIDGEIIESTNITFDQLTGIGKWSESEFVKAVKTGVRPDNSSINYPMEKYTLLDDAEVSAIYAYLKTVPTIVNNIKN